MGAGVVWFRSSREELAATMKSNDEGNFSNHHTSAADPKFLRPSRGEFVSGTTERKAELGPAATRALPCGESFRHSSGATRREDEIARLMFEK